ncbi:unnamed protein product, partial [Meganyctiphanes norvegica]
PTKDCLVYSFGVGNDITFEESLTGLKHCEMHMFDPAANDTDMQTLSPGQHYHVLGLGLENADVAQRDFQIQVAGGLTVPESIKSRTLERILSDLGHTGRPIHYLKIDVEGHEWRELPVSKKGRILLKEFISRHLRRGRVRPFESRVNQVYSDILRSLEALGFRRVSYRHNYNALSYIKLPYEDQGRPTCGEVLYINQRYQVSL